MSFCKNVRLFIDFFTAAVYNQAVEVTAVAVMLANISPYIRYVNYYVPVSSYVENERMLYDHEFMYVIDGAVSMFYGGEHYRLVKGDLFYLSPFVKNFIKVEEKDGFKTHCIHFDWTCGERESEFSAEEFYVHSGNGAEYEKRKKRLLARPDIEPEDFRMPRHMRGVGADVGMLFKKCYYAYISGAPASVIAARAAFMDIVAELARIFTDGREPIHPKTAAAVEYIQKNYGGRISVPELAEKYGLSPKYFGTVFKNSTGKSVNEFVAETRMAAAKEMLLGTDMPIGEIAEKTGYGSAYYFSKCFKKHEKLSPLRFRENWTGKY